MWSLALAPCWALFGLRGATLAKTEDRWSLSQTASFFAGDGVSRDFLSARLHAGRDRGAALEPKCVGTSTKAQRRDRTKSHLRPSFSALTSAGRSRRVARHSSASTRPSACCSLILFACSMGEDRPTSKMSHDRSRHDACTRGAVEYSRH